MNKKFVFVLMFTLLLLVSMSAFAKDVTLRVTWWGSQNRHDRTLEAIKIFEKQNPGIKIEAEFLGWGGYWENIAAQAAGGNLPDIWQQDYSYITMYANRGLLLDLNPYVESGHLDLSYVANSAIAGGIVDGSLYGISLGQNAMTVAYDPDIFAEAGIKEPTADWTWEDYINIVETIHDKLGIYGDSGLPYGGDRGFQYYLRQHGKDLYNETGDGLGYEDDKYFIDYFKMDYDLVKKGAFAPIDIRTELGSLGPEVKLINDKEAAMESSLYSNQLVALESAAGRKFKFITPPKDKNQIQDGLYLKPSMFFSVTKYTEHPEEAVKFIDFFTNSLEANKVLHAERGVPISSKIREDLSPYLGDIQQRTFDYIDLASKHSTKISPPEPEQVSKVVDLMSRLHSQLLFDLISVEEAAEDFRAEATEILSK